MDIQCIKDLTQHWQQERGLDENLSTDLCPPDMDGDLTLNCFRLAKPLKGNPMQIAAEAVEFLSNHADVAKAEAIKAFVNITLTNEALYRDTIGDEQAMMDAALLPEDERKRMLIEYSAPNTNKPLHLGHLRNNSLGMALVEILKRVGHDVVPVNLVNDRGVHICKSMIAYQRFGNDATPETYGKKGDHMVGDFYVKYDQELKKQVAELKAAQPELADESEDKLFPQTEIGAATQQMLMDWEEGKDDVIALWKMMNGWVLNGFGQTYDRMGVKFDKCYFESDTYKLGKDIIDAGLEKGIFYKRDDGATEIDLSSRKLDKKVVLRSDGTSVYITQDLGTTLLKAEEFKPDGMMWIVGNEQIYHFRVLFAILTDLGYEWADSLYHLAYGMVELPEGKMKSREGTVVDADNLFDEMHELAKKAILERVGDNVPEDIEHRAEVIGMGAAKFMLLKVNPKTTMKFDPQAAVKFEGDTGALVQYSFARISSIERNAVECDVADSVDWSLLSHEKEREIAVKCANYGNVLRKAAADYDTCCLANYLIELARGFNSFYHDCPVVKGDGLTPELRAARLELIRRVKAILGDGLAVLTIDKLESM